MKRPAIMLLALCACAPEDNFPVVGETEHVIVGLDPNAEGRLCEGDFSAFELQVQQTEEVLGIEQPGKVFLNYWTSDSTPGPCDRVGANGCFTADSMTIEATDHSWRHELVHSVMEGGGHQDGDLLLREAVADLLSGRAMVAPAPLYPLDAVFGTDSSQARRVGHHFVAWASWTYGTDGLAALGTTADPEEAIQAWTGLTVAQAQLEYEAEARYIYPSAWSCGEPLEPAADGGFELEVELRCDSDDVASGGDDALSTCRTFEVEQTAVYGFSFSGFGTLQRCVVEPEEAPPTYDLLPPIPTNEGSNRRIFPEGSGEVLLEVKPGTYQICVGVLGQHATSAELEVRRTEAEVVEP